MSMTHTSFLLRQASTYWEKHEPLPLDLFYRLLGAGIDVAYAEKQFTNEQQETN